MSIIHSQYVEAKLIVPMQANDGSNELSDGARYHYRLKELERLLAQKFDGYTRINGRGAWYDYSGSGLQSEHVAVYLLAFDGADLLAVAAFDGLRNWVKDRLEQKTVYLSHVYLEDAPIQ